MARHGRLLSLVFALFALSGAGADECTTAIVSPRAGEDGRPILWKNRDTDVLSNRVDALRTCRTVADFEAYLKANLGGELGARTNFGVIGAAGAAVILEVDKHGYERLDAAAVPEGYLVNTNYSRTGREAKGSGYVRFARATELALGQEPHGHRVEDAVLLLDVGPEQGDEGPGILESELGLHGGDRIRCARRRAMSSASTRPASIVWPRPTPSASSIPGRLISSALTTGTSW